MSGTLLLAAFILVGGPLALASCAWLLGVRYISHDQVGVVERLWSPRGSLAEGRILALEGEAGFQAVVLRGGLHFGYFPFVYRVHSVPLVTVPQGGIAYVYARDGHPLDPTQSLGRVVTCNDFQDAQAFLSSGGQRGRQRAILREGVYAINLAQFVVLTESAVYTADGDAATYERWRQDLAAIDAFTPVRVGGQSDTLGVVTVHDGVPLASGRDHRPRGAGSRVLPVARRLPRPGRSPRPPAPGAHGRHVLPQPLVCDRGAQAQDGHPHRVRGGGRELLRNWCPRSTSSCVG
jgi:hypothetical protein